MSREDPIRSVAVLNPLLEGGQHLECVGPFTAAAMTHPWRHEEPVAIVHSASAVKCVEDAPVILRAVARRDLRIAPPVILNQLAAVIDERLEIWIERVDRVSVGIFRSRDIAFAVEL